MKIEVSPSSKSTILLKGSDDLMKGFQSPDNLVLFLSEALKWHRGFKFKNNNNDYSWYISVMLEMIVPVWYRNAKDCSTKIAEGIEEITRFEGYIGFMHAVQGLLMAFAESYDIYSWDDPLTQKFSDNIRSMIKLSQSIMEYDRIEKKCNVVAA